MEISPPLADSFEKTENISCFPLVGVPPFATASISLVAVFLSKKND
jgi:hypothetical protein